MINISIRSHDQQIDHITWSTDRSDHVIKRSIRSHDWLDSKILRSIKSPPIHAVTTPNNKLTYPESPQRMSFVNPNSTRKSSHPNQLTTQKESQPKVSSTDKSSQPTNTANHPNAINPVNSLIELTYKSRQPINPVKPQIQWTHKSSQPINPVNP